MIEQFFEQPILNSPYEYPALHWELDEDGQPTNKLIESRRPSKFLTPIPKPKKRKKSQDDVQQALPLYDTEGISDESQAYDLSLFINSVRKKVNAWRQLPNPADWKVTPETARLLQHWRSHKFQSLRPFFCQVEAVETAIWLAEVAPKGRSFLAHIERVNEEANPELMRIALKLATGAGKTTVMAMLIAWQTVNAVRHPQSNRFTRGFLLVTPGITIRDRLRVLQPNDPDSYYASRELLPSDMLPDLQKAKIVITNYHAFKLRERMQLAAGTRKLVQGRGPAPLKHQSGQKALSEVCGT
jgi:type III restriction enzyme